MSRLSTYFKNLVDRIKKTNKKTWIKRLLIVGSVFICCLFILFIDGIIWVGELSDRKYPIQGVDVSHFQGKIDWEVLAGEDIDFAYIKATEGSKTVDSCFEYNFKDARKTKLKIGAYHFFSFDSPGQTQADNFIENVPVEDDMLPPVIDIEFYGDKESNPPLKENVDKELGELIVRLENTYGKTPVIYCTYTAYKKYIENSFDSCKLWIRNTYYKPGVFDGVDWTIWQYSDKGLKKGYDGRDPEYGVEEHIDLNVFYGDKEAFREFYEASVLQ